MNTTHHAPRTLILLALLFFPAGASAQVNPSGSWRTLHTKHFRIHFRPSFRARATLAAAEAERAYTLLASELHPPRGIVDITLSDDIDTPNGFTTTFPSNRFTILLVPPVTDPALQTYDSWERLVIVHELTHVFHLDRARGLWNVLQDVFGRAPGLFPNQYQPTWVTEGLATYYESRFTAGGRAEGSFHREVVAADAVFGHARSPWEAVLFTRWPDGLAPYAYGSRFWEFLSHTVNDSVVPRFVEKTAGQLIPFRVGRQLRLAGLAPSLADAWSRSIATAVPASQSGARAQLLVGRLRSQPVPRVSPDGRSLAYLYDDGRGARGLRVVDPVSGAVLRSHRVNGGVSYDWLGDTLIVAQLEFTGRWTIRSDLWRWAPPPDDRWKRQTTNGRLIEPRAGGGTLSALKLAGGGDAPTIPAPPIDGTWGPIVPSPDGRWIAATRNQNGRWELVRWPAGDTQSVGVLARAVGDAAIADPVWTPDGTSVLFVTDAGGFPQIHRWRASDGISQLTAEPLGARAPAPLPDGRILFTTLGDGGWELRVATPRPVVQAPAALAPAAYDSAPGVAFHETGYSSWGSLRPHFWIPLGVNAGRAGRFFGAATAGSDAVDRYFYFAQAQVSPSPLRLQGAFFLLSQAFGNPTLDLSFMNRWSLLGIDSAGHVVSQNRPEADIGATVVVQRWRSFASLRLAAEYEGRRFVSIPDTNLAAICNGCSDRDRVGGSAILSIGSAVTGPLTVSLQDGATASILYRRTEEQGNARFLNEVRARANLYVRLGPRVGFASSVLALRGAIGGLDGPIADRFSIGGASSGGVQFLFGQTVGASRTFPVRGYAAGVRHGRHAATLSAEYRMPLALIGRALGHLPFGADKLGLSVFGDMGDAWDVGQRAQLTRLRSVGAELVADVTLTYDIPLRLRFGVAQPATGHAQLYGAFGADF